MWSPFIGLKSPAYRPDAETTHLNFNNQEIAAFGQHGSTVEGIAPGCQGLILPIFRQENDVISPCSQLDLARAISQAVNAGANIINISGGQFSLGGDADLFLDKAIELCVNNNVLVICAAGNEGKDAHHVPASLPDVLAVGAMDSTGNPMEFSNWGERYISHGILAPGDKIRGPEPGGTIGYRSGTSYATPVVTGLVALFLSLQRMRGEELTPYKIRDALLQSVVPCNPQEESNCQRFLAGKLDVKKTYSILFGNYAEQGIVGDEVTVFHRQGGAGSGGAGSGLDIRHLADP